VVEHRLAKARVASSSLVSRSNNPGVKAESNEGKGKKSKGKVAPADPAFSFKLFTFAFHLPPSSFILVAAA
jgi:hypothetical protein